MREHTLGAEVEEGGELATLVVASQHDDLFRPRQLHGQDEQEHLDGEVSSVHVVTQEDVLGVLTVATHICLQ